MKPILHCITLFTICLTVLCGCKKQAPDLVAIADHIKSITVYDLEGLSAADYSEQDLRSAFQASLDPQLFRELAPEAKYKDDWVLWKGSRLAVVTMDDGVQEQLALSYYGAFFKVLGKDGYFYFEGDAREKWEKAFSTGIVQDDFIPKRIERNKRREEKP